MPPYHLSYSDQLTIRDLHKQGRTATYIAKQLHCTRWTVYKYINRECIHPIHKTKSKVGRKRKLSEIQTSKLTTLLTQHNKLGSRRIAPIVNKRLRTCLHDRTIRRYAVRAQLKWKKPITKPLLSAIHKEKRVVWAKQNINNDWSKWIFSDETTIDIYGNNYGQRVASNEQVIQQKTKYPLKVHCWWAISTHTHFTPYIFTENMTADLYLSILQSRLPTTHTHHYPNGWVFQQDNDPKHKAKQVREWLDSHTPHWTSDWPPQSPDLNPIENIWSIVKADVYTQQPTDRPSLEHAIKKACQNISTHTIAHTIASMKNRLNTVIQTRGANTKY